MQRFKNALSVAFCALIFLSADTYQTSGYTVTNLAATYSNGQVFLTWNNASAVNLQYNVYRSSSQINSSSQLTSSNLLGFVRDSSAKNIRISQLDKKNIFFRIKDKGTPLAGNQGLYVVTCTGNQGFYYAVTVTDLSTGNENKTLTLGQNSLSNVVSENAVQPMPVFQDSIIQKSGAVRKRYVLFVNNQETSLFPAMNTTGPLAMNFYLLKIGTATSGNPVLIQYDVENNGVKKDIVVNDKFSYGYVLGVDDWLPVKNSDGSIGNDDYYCCYDQNFNIYTDANPIPTTGTVKTYPQKSYYQMIKWVKKNFPVDTTRVYTTGTSHTGYGALMTAAIYPGLIAAVYDVVEPITLGPNGVLVYEEEWGIGSTKLSTDVNSPKTGQPLLFQDLGDMRTMANANDNLESVPLIFDVHGKNDNMVVWGTPRLQWFDSLQTNHVGGAWYWDQRKHNGDGKNFTSDETTPDFFRYQTTKSYPAFANCSINQNPGNGTKTSGAQYGGINSYLDFNDTITDQTCNYSVNVFIKDLYVGGVLDKTQYDTCTADVTFRRLQNFNPTSGQTIKWSDFDYTNNKLQSGSIVYNGGLITLKGIKINKTGNTLALTISGCSGPKLESVAPGDDAPVFFYHDAGGYVANIESDRDDEVLVTVYDVMGRMVWEKQIQVPAGTTSARIPNLPAGMYAVKVEGRAIHYSQGLLFQ